MASFQLLTRRSLFPIAGSLISVSLFTDKKNRLDCEYPNNGKRCMCDNDTGVSPPTPIRPISSDIQNLSTGIKSDKNTLTSSQSKMNNVEAEERNDGEKLFHNLFPLRQLWSPKVEYPLWDKNWDGRDIESTGSKEADRDRQRLVRKNGITRHIILVRHGQYDETHKEDEKRILTPLGREQAKLTGKRIAEMIQGFDDDKFGPCNVTTIRVSDMARAKETADIIANQLPSHVHRANPDANLNEGRPCHTIPGGKVSSAVVEKTDESHSKIEKAFQTYFHRAEYQEGGNALKASIENKNDGAPDTLETFIPSPTPGKLTQEKTDKKDQGHPQHEFEIIVCHANVLRYMFCRALQIPPEAWLRLCTFNCSLTYLTIRPTGSVSCRMLGDIGHLGYEHSTFSMHHGFNW